MNNWGERERIQRQKQREKKSEKWFECNQSWREGAPRDRLELEL